MSMSTYKTVKCPQCGAEISVRVWSSINTMIDTAIPDIISGKLFDVKCEKCGYETFVNYPILFNDMINMVMIYYVFPESLEETVKSMKEQFIDRGIRARVVTSQSELREKAAIFNAGLDDRVVELLKVLMMILIKPQIEGKEVGHVYYFDDNGSPSIEFSLDGERAMVPLGMERYNLVLEQNKERLDSISEECVVDSAWAHRFLKSKQLEQQSE